MAYIPFLNNAYFSAKVGIGTDSPTGKLDVREANVTISTSNSMSDGIRGLKIDGSNAGIELAGSGNDWWVSAFMDSGKIVQDVPQVLGHYRSRFNKPYKGNKPSELRELYTLTS
jgi:hypothetical protein